ncbi:glycosyltransferase family 4 protein [Helicobacter himalayensis]|uniref:glycosyltransferase family 4 protein n=1 Tax=Helicobacter himalayensis TaxID=1591088 RepID=UPI003D6EF876
MQNDRSKNVLIASLTRKGGGFEHYTISILQHFSLPYTVYQSKYVNPESKIAHAKTMITYTNKLTFVLNSLFILPFIFIKLCFIAKRYDVLYLPHFHFWNIVFIFAFRLHNKPVVLTEHDGIVHLGDELPLQQALINACIKHSTHIIFLTHYVKSLVSPKLLKGKQISIIPHGIFAFEGLHTKQKTYKNKPTLLFFGRVSKYKGIELLLEAISTIPETSFNKLIIAGKSSYTYNISNLKESVVKKIEIIDAFLPQQKIVELFNQAHILIMPYLEASQSGVAAVGIANAMPTICTDVGGLKEQFILANSNGGGAIVSSALSFANRMQMILLLPFCIWRRIECFIMPLATTSPFWRKA